MKRADLMNALETLWDNIPSDNVSRDITSAYFSLSEFIAENTKAEEKIPALLRGSEDDT